MGENPRPFGEIIVQLPVMQNTINLCLVPPGGSSRKGRSKKEAEDHTNRPNPGGHERKIVLKLQRTEQKRKGTASKK
uniref:Nuclear protein 1 n=1 Tax=Podarcis muralis TaxID=64176 RepID=A0A670K8C0_PODMU